MPVAALFAQQRGRVPQLGQRFVRPVQRDVGREQRSAIKRRAAGGFRGEDSRGLRLVIAHAVPAQRRDGRIRTGAQSVGRRGDFPRRSQRLGDARRGEVVEHGGHDFRWHGAQRCRARGEITHPESPAAQPVERGPRFRREVGDGVHRFEAVKETACKRGVSAHVGS